MLLINLNRQVPVSGQRTVIILDTGVTDYLSLLRGISSDTEIILLNSTQNGIEYISQTLSCYKDIQFLHIVSHGNKGCLALGNQLLNSETLETHASRIQQWKTALAENGEILLYGCHVASGEEGIRFVRRLAELTQAKIAASNSLTGNAALGGNWRLEFQTQPITTPLAFSREILQAYSGVLILLVDESFANSTLSPQPFTDELKWIFGSDQSVQDPNDLESPFLTARPFREPEPGGIAGVPEGRNTDPEGQGTLRFTSNANDQASFIIYDFPVRSDAGLELQFDYFAYGGTGADGISFFLIDGEDSPQRSGGFGGSLGYAPRTDQNIPGLVGGYIGIGFDEFGNFASSQDKGVGNDGSPGRTPNAITVRGSAENNYQFLTTTGRLNNFNLDTRNTTIRENATRTVKILITQEGLLSVALDLNLNGEIDENETLISEFDVQSENGGDFPSNFKFGFAASTGRFTNFHEIRNVQVRTLEEPPVLDLEGETPNVVDFETTFTQGEEPVAIASSTKIEDADDESLEQARITLTNVLDAGEESLSLNEESQAIIDQFNLNVTGNGTDEIIIEGSASLEDYEKILDNIVYNNTADEPTLTPRQVEVFVRDKLRDDGFDSNLAVTTINIDLPVEPNILPVAENITNSEIVANSNNIPLQPLQGMDEDGEIVGFRITQLPVNGLLFFNGELLDVTQEIPLNQAGNLTLTPDTDFVGNLQFQYTAIDNDGDEDLTPATFSIPVVAENIPPVAENITNSEIVANSSNISLQPLQGMDEDGEIVGFRITQLPVNGKLFFNGELLDVTQEIPLNQAGNLTLTPDTDFVGNLQFQYTAIDDDGDEDLTPATFSIPVVAENIPTNIPPVAENITNSEIVENSSNISLQPLQGMDEDGEIVGFRITRLPTNGLLFLNGVLLNNTTQEIPVDEAGNLTLTPETDFVGNLQFQYTAIDDDGDEDLTPATFSIPVIAENIPTNIPPVAENITNSEIVENSNNISLQPLQGMDEDGEIVGFRITQLPVNGRLFFNGELLDVTQEIPLNQAGNITLTPDTDFVGNLQFQYTAIDNDGDEDLTPATFSIPVVAENIPTNIPPVAENITNSEIVANSSNISLQPLQGMDEDGEIVSFRITQLPVNGRLFFNGELLDVTQEIPFEEAGNITLTPDTDFVGNLQFQYTAIDDDGDEDLTPATFSIPVVAENIPTNIPPVAENITNSEIVENSSNISLQPLQGMDEDGEIVGFRITRLPVNGRLFFNGELLDVTQEIPFEEAGNLTLTPDTDFVGNLQFQYTAIDDDGDEDLTPATFSIPVVAENIPTNIPPVAESQTIPTVKNTLSQVSLPALNATDEDGIVESFTILELPTGGELLLSGEAVQNNQPISINQASQLTFIPNQDFVGESQFSFIVTDDDGATSNLATVTIPLIANQPPIAESVATQPFLNNQVNVAFPSLIASDSDGEVELFSLTNLPASNQGKLFLDGIEVSNISQVQQLTDSQISSLSFTPNSSFVGNLELGYFAIDNDGESSNIATITFPIITQQVPLDPPNLPPIAEDLSLFDLINDASDITIPTLTATDADGQVVSFIINSLPSTGQLFLDQTAITTLTQVQQLTLDQASQLTYVPNSGFLGTVTFTYQATDNDNAISNIATITLEIDSTTIPREDDEIDLICGCIPLPILEGIPLPEPPVFPIISFDSIPISLEGTENDDILFGSNESERIVGLGGNDWIFGEAGNDSLEGNLGNDFIKGGSGDDIIDGGSGNDVLFGWLGEDTLFGNSGNNTLFGGTNDLFIPDLNGRDWLISGDNDDFLQGNEGNDVISGGNGNDLAFGGKDDDKIYGDLGNDTLFGNLGNDTLIADPGRENILDNTNNADVLYGNQGNDLLQGSLGNDTIYGGKEDDFAYGGKDNDLLRGELGNDTLFGDKGNDTLFGDTNYPNQTELEGRDLLWGGIGNDVIFGNSDNDTLMGGEAEDKLYGGKGDDLLFGESGNDQLFGDLGNDTLCGNDGNDTLFGDIIGLEDLSENVDFQDQVDGGRGDDLLFGNGGDDLLCGGEGNDTLYGGRGDDTLVGGDGDDRLFGDIGNDTLYGDLGRDGFILSSNSGTNRILDFTNGEDYLGLIGGLTFSDLTIETGENQTLIFVETKLIAQLIGVQVNSITAEDFLELE
ncbi:DUF4347 domain-containing protein [Limnoraphis robusta]|uniref:DUF4347 domain-containing protein n=1 Tax=Limnoraphis robusta CS-951 TaxID=1637645 RepID=A0A0J9EXI9_9CYAN|nr:DUF4347 domain-containing protein [Limnoraphis robusta]KMW70692.1 hypothetical protein WN50_33375 [Limnoraphis robusta CS-951]